MILMDKTGAEKESRRRVKLYVLNASRHWDDRGTGHVQAIHLDRCGGIALVVRDETSSEVLLESKIEMDTSYQKQQETLIVWSENESDMALSFQEKSGCEEVWAKICQVQNKDPTVEITQDSFEDDDDEDPALSVANYPADGGMHHGGGFALPLCEMGRLERIAEVVQQHMSHPAMRDKLANAVEQEGYIKKLLEVFRKCEDLEHKDGLQHLYTIMRGILMLNRNALYDILFSDENIDDVLGCLEWDPASPKKHRKYIKETAKFKEVVPIQNPDLLQKIQQMYRIQYIQDVVLPSPTVFEDNVLNVLHSVVFYLKIDIVNTIQEDERFLRELFAQLTNPDVSLEKRRDAMQFLREFCQFSQTLQAPSREAFFRMLVQHGVLGAIQGALDVDDIKTRSAVVDVFSYIVELHPFVVREYSMTQAAKETDDNKLFFVHIIKQAVLNDPDPQAAGAMQVLTIMRLLLDPESMIASPMKAEKTEFLSFFYKRCFPHLVDPIKDFNAAVAAGKKEDLRKVQILNLITDFFGYCVEHHSFHIKNYLIGHDLLKHVMQMTRSTHQFLVIAVVRFLRKIVGLSDKGIRNFYINNIEKGEHLRPIIELLLKNGRRNNLLNSAILELFEYIRQENIKPLIRYIIGQHGEKLKGISYTKLFDQLQLRYNANDASLPEPSGSMMPHDRPQTPEPETVMKTRMGRRGVKRDEREMDEDEEQWFQSDDADEGEGSQKNTDANQLPSSIHSTSALMKILPPVNAAPPVKRPLNDNDDDDDLPFSGSRFSGGKAARKITCRSPSPSSLKVSLASADSTRHLPSSSNQISSSTSSSPETSPTSLTPTKSVPSPTSSNPASPSLVDYPDDDEEPTGGSSVSNSVPTKEGSPSPSAPISPERQEVSL